MFDVINTKTKETIVSLTDRKAALELRKTLNRESYFNNDNVGRYRIVENLGYAGVSD
jgi:hypothetical protein